MNWNRYRELVALDAADRPEEALLGLQELLDAAVTDDQKSAVWLAIGSCLRHLGRKGEARAAIRRAEDSASSESEGLAWVIFAEACLDLDEGNWKEALDKCGVLISKFSSLLELPENQAQRRHIQWMRGIALAELRRPAEAYPLLSIAVNDEVGKETALYYLGRCQFDLGEFEKSKESLRKALVLGLHSGYQPSAHYILALIHYGQHQYAWAMRELEWCVENDRQGRVPRTYVLRSLAETSMALGLAHEAEKYSKMLQDV